MIRTLERFSDTFLYSCSSLQDKNNQMAVANGNNSSEGKTLGTLLFGCNAAHETVAVLDCESALVFPQQ